MLPLVFVNSVELMGWLILPVIQQIYMSHEYNMCKCVQWCYLEKREKVPTFQGSFTMEKRYFQGYQTQHPYRTNGHPHL